MDSFKVMAGDGGIDGAAVYAWRKLGKYPLTWLRLLVESMEARGEQGLRLWRILEDSSA